MSIAKTIMVQGTASNVGKSIVTTALCRILTRSGYKVAPFKAQNMANNSFVTKEGGEIGRAQAVQAFACNVEPTQDMNPILLKPNSDQTSQVVVMGKPNATFSARDYQSRKKYLSSYVFDALDRLRRDNDIVVIEGAGSCAEINMKQYDIVNMNVAKYAQSPVILVADIDKGGVFAQIVGTFELLDSQEKQLVRTFLINKFRGDKSILDPGIDWIEQKLDRKSLGVLPMIKDINIEEEDAVMLDEDLLSKNRLVRHLSKPSENDKLLIQIIRLPRISNFTDFEQLSKEENVIVQYIDQPNRNIMPDLLILPGTKSTMGDLEFLKRTGFADFIRRAVVVGVHIMGVCGGFQMMGESIEDPHGLESASSNQMDGLGIFSAVTIFDKEKTTVQVKAKHIESGSLIEGYEIHMGQTQFNKEVQPMFNIVERQGERVDQYDGVCMRASNIYGTYIHGLFDSKEFRQHFLNQIRENINVKPMNYNKIDSRPCPYDSLADVFEQHLNLNVLDEILEGSLV